MARTPKIVLLASLLLASACADDPVVPEPAPGPEPQPGDELLYHENERAEVYPKLNNEVYLNPPPLLVPTAFRGDSLMQFEVSASPDFKSSVFLSEPHPWGMASPHRRLEPGRWYWRYRCHTADGQTVGGWHGAIPFDVPNDVPEYVTPSLDRFNDGLKSGHPRMQSFLDGRLEASRTNIASHPEYRSLIGRATIGLSFDISDISRYYVSKSDTEELNHCVNYLYQAYYLTQDERYAEKMYQILRQMILRPATDSELWGAASNFQPTNIAQAMAWMYDILFERLQPGERSACEAFLSRIVRQLAKVHLGKREAQIFETHFWQHNMLVGFQCAYLLHDKLLYRDEALLWLDYCYEIWATRAPGTGFNRDGVWHNSASYLNTNTETLTYMPLILGDITGGDFLSHPWYQNAGKAMVYTWPSGSKSCGFGDGSNAWNAPGRIRIALADFLARHTGDEYAGWYAAECRSDLRSDFELRLERMVNSMGYSTEKPENIDKLIWYKDAGEVVMHSDLGDTSDNLSLSFRSSRYGCVNHTYANQNAFNLVYRGVDVFRNTGYYFKYGSTHHMMDCRHTRAHNTILVNGVGQAFDNAAYGNVTRAAETDNIVYCLGDASHAYADTSYVDAWVKNIAAVGMKQTPEFGFGKTPLTKYLRHCVMLPPSIALVYDEIEASEPATIDWLLNSPDEIHADFGNCAVTKVNAAKKFAADGRLFSSMPLTASLTDEFVVSPGSESQYPKQWHFAARTQVASAQRFLFIVRVRELSDAPVSISATGGVAELDGWRIEANLDPSTPAALTITNSENGAVLEYRAGTGLTRITDKVKGKPAIVETDDYLPKHTRSIE